MQRRNFLKGSLATTTLSIAVGSGLLRPTNVSAAYPMAAFESENTMDALKSILGTGEASESTDLTLKAPIQAENGAVVPIKVSANVPVDSIAIVVEGNPRPLVMTSQMGAGTNGALSGRIKMGKTSNVVVYAKTSGGVIKTSQEVKVTVGGCGG